MEKWSPASPRARSSRFRDLPANEDPPQPREKQDPLPGLGALPPGPSQYPVTGSPGACAALVRRSGTGPTYPKQLICSSPSRLGRTIRVWGEATRPRVLRSLLPFFRRGEGKFASDFKSSKNTRASEACRRVIARRSRLCPQPSTLPLRRRTKWHARIPADQLLGFGGGSPGRDHCDSLGGVREEGRGRSGHCPVSAAFGGGESDGARGGPELHRGRCYARAGRGLRSFPAPPHGTSLWLRAAVGAAEGAGSSLLPLGPRFTRTPLLLSSPPSPLRASPGPPVSVGRVVRPASS